jgi:hypothetical protein
MNHPARCDAALQGGQTKLHTKRTTLAAATLGLLLISVTAVFAADPQTHDDGQEAKESVEAQQRPIEAESKVSQELLPQVPEPTENDGKELAPAGTQTAPAPEAPAGKDPQEEEPEWPGSFSLFGSKTRFAIGGFVQFDAIYDTDAISTRCEFVTSAIATDGGTPAGGAEGQTSFCINATRLTFESRTPTELGRLKTFVSLDFFGDPNSPSLRMRQAYGELSGALWGGDLLMGQAWGTFVDLDAWPDTLDYEGPNSAIFSRQPLVRWSKGISAGIDFQVAAEKPGDGAIEAADTLTRWPDLIGAVKWKHGGGHLRGAGIFRDVRASADDNPAQTATGWGLAGSGKVLLPAKSNLVFEVSYGEGTGGYYNDGPPNAVYDPATSSLELLPVFAYYVGFEHSWSKTLSSALLYAALEVDNLEAEPDDAFRKSAYFSLNLIWRPATPLMFGVEFLRGGREDKDGAEGTDNRVQLTSHFSF